MNKERFIKIATCVVAGVAVTKITEKAIVGLKNLGVKFLHPENAEEHLEELKSLINE